MIQTKISTLIRTSRPAFLLLTPCCLSVAVAFAVYEGVEIDPVNLILIALGALSAHISVNMLNEYHDFKTGLDLRTQRTPFSGGSGALPQFPEWAKSVYYAGLIALIITIIIGFYFLRAAGWGLLPVGLSGILLVYFYTPQITHRPLLCLLAPGFGFGPFMILGAYYLLTGRYHLSVVIAAFIIFFVVNNLLLLNQFPDLEPDQEAGRLHFPILLGRKKSALIYLAFLLMAYALLLLSVYLKLLPIYSLLGMLTLLLAIPAASLVLRFYNNIARLMPALGLNVALTLSLPVLISLGLIWDRLLKL